MDAMSMVSSDVGYIEAVKTFFKLDLADAQFSGMKLNKHYRNEENLSIIIEKFELFFKLEQRLHNSDNY